MQLSSINNLNLHYFPFLLNDMTTSSNLKTYLPSALKRLVECHFKIRWKNKRNIIVSFQSGQLTGKTKILDDLAGFDLKCFRNCPIIIKIITGSHIFILFLPHIGTLCLHFIPRYLLW